MSFQNKSDVDGVFLLVLRVVSISTCDLFFKVLLNGVNVKLRNEQRLSDHSPKQLVSNISSRAAPFKGRRSGILQRFGNGGCFNSRIKLAHTFLIRGDQKAA